MPADFFYISIFALAVSFSYAAYRRYKDERNGLYVSRRPDVIRFYRGRK